MGTSPEIEVCIMHLIDAARHAGPSLSSTTLQCPLIRALKATPCSASSCLNKHVTQGRRFHQKICIFVLYNHNVLLIGIVTNNNNNNNNNNNKHTLFPKCSYIWNILQMQE